MRCSVLRFSISTFTILILGVSTALAQAPPSPSVTGLLGPDGTPPLPGIVNLNATWANCTDAKTLKIIPYKVTGVGKAKKKAKLNISTTPIQGANNSTNQGLGAVHGFVTGDLIVCDIQIIDGAGQVVASGTTNEFTVP
jgi:hypothetical protein